MPLIYTNARVDSPAQLATRTDPRAIRMRRMLSLPDLSRKPDSPVYHVVRAVLGTRALAGCDDVVVPEIVSVAENFDLLNAPPEHPARGPGDTYYVDDTHVLRTHTTSFWPRYLGDPAVRRRLDGGETITAVCYGKVYRNDEIDRNHYPVFHQIDALRLCRRDTMNLSLEDLKDAVVEIARAICGQDVECRITPEHYPFTDPSIQLEVEWKQGWIELMGAGMVHPKVLTNLGLDPEQYGGWAFGFGLDRLAMVKAEIPDIRILWLDDERVARQFIDPDAAYLPVSKYPPVTRDISLLVKASVPVNQLYETMRACGDSLGEDLIEEVTMIDRYASAALGPENVSYTFRIVYRSHLRTLTSEEINGIQEDVRTAVVRELGARLR